MFDKFYSSLLNASGKLATRTTLIKEIYVIKQRLPAIVGIILFSFLITGASPVRPAETRNMQTCFVPGEDCTQFIVDAIRLGRAEVLVQAYNFTSPPILLALSAAKAAGAAVHVLLDKSNEQPRYTGATFAENHGIPVLIDDKVAIAHNKVIIIDGQHVLTGSFNFTKSAQDRNAENVILIKNDPALAKRYRDNWMSRRAVSRHYRSLR